jgi:NTP pyrophosphatase (non-canonical NTP hydrolase)
MNTTEYLLSCLIEECAEVIQRATKAQRFGLDEIQPEQSLTNEARLRIEVADAFATVLLLADEGVNLEPPDEMVRAKMAKVKKFMDYSREQGCLHK